MKWREVENNPPKAISLSIFSLRTMACLSCAMVRVFRELVIGGKYRDDSRQSAIAGVFVISSKDFFHHSVFIP